MNKSLTKIHNSTAKEISDAIRPLYFPNLSSSSFENIVTQYKESKLWPKNTALPASSFVRLKASLLSGGLIQKDIPYHLIIDHKLSQPGAVS
jgi:NitT/TauT family transport system substrate-binding protein